MLISVQTENPNEIICAEGIFEQGGAESICTNRPAIFRFFAWPI
jgi:hypothetical protein